MMGTRVMGVPIYRETQQERKKGGREEGRVKEGEGNGKGRTMRRLNGVIIWISVACCNADGQHLYLFTIKRCNLKL